MKADDISSVTQSFRDMSSSSYTGGEDGALAEGVAADVPLHGREREKNKVLETYQRVLQTQESQIVFVHGTSGQGKTSLVDTLREPVCRSNGYFCSGKFFQDPGIQEPYSAITAAFSDLCDLVVQSAEFDEQSPEFDEQAHTQMQEFLAIHGHLLSRSVNLSPFLASGSLDRESFTNISPEKKNTFAIFRAACKAFLLAMASTKHPVVLFIDDVQWMDAGSARLLDLIRDRDVNNVMMIFSYRDEEASAIEDLLHSYKEGSTRVTDIQLSNLDLAGVRQILAHRLGSTASNLNELSELTLQRTGGNPYFVLLFLETLEREEFLALNRVSAKFDVGKIRSVIMVADSIADCLSEKVSRLTSEVKDILSVASLVGYFFDEDILLGVPDIFKFAVTEDEKREKLASRLELSLDERYIERVRGGYQFAHDKVQSAFQDLLDEPSRDRLHHLIGMAFLNRNTQGAIYNAVVHLNVAPGFLTSNEQSIRLARINLDASQFCKQSSAFYMAVSLLRKGLEFLGAIQMKWSPETFDLSLELTEGLARMSLLVGDFSACFEATREALFQVETKEQKISLLLVNVECRMANNDMEGSINASIEALSELGVEFPRKATILQTMIKLSKVKLMMAGKTNEDMQALPRVEVGSTSADAVRLLMHITFYSVLINEIVGSLYSALLAIELTLQHGVSTFSAPALANFAVATMHMGNVERAYSLGKWSLELMEQNASREADCPTLGFVNPLVLHWKEPVSDLRGPLFMGATAGFERGDVLYATYCIYQGQSMAMFDGIHLSEMENSLRSQYKAILDLGQQEIVIWMRPSMQFVANLRSSNTEWLQLSNMSGGFIDFHMHLIESNASRNTVLVKAGVSLMKARLANVFGFHQLARERFEELEPLEYVLRSVFVFNLMCWEASVAYYEGFIAEGKRKHLRKARKYKKHLERRDAYGPNASAYLTHLKVKETFLRRRRRPWTDLSLYNNETLRFLDRELESFSLSGNDSSLPCYVIARAFVDAGSIAESLGCFGEARQYYERARGVYAENWGAIAPAAWLGEKCDALPTNDPLEVASNTRNMLVGDIVQFERDE